MILLPHVLSQSADLVVDEACGVCWAFSAPNNPTARRSRGPFSPDSDGGAKDPLEFWKSTKAQAMAAEYIIEDHFSMIDSLISKERLFLLCDLELQFQSLQ